jgi:hypothetical protein
MNRKTIPRILVAVWLFGPFVGIVRADDDERREFFESRIRPVLIEHCYECHSAKSKEIKGSLRLDSAKALLQGGDSGPAIVPGKPKQSPLLEALRYEGVEMPPAGRLPERIVRDFEQWVKTGAFDPREETLSTSVPKMERTIDIEAGRQFWAFQPVVRDRRPAVSDTTWPVTDVDAFVLAKLEAASLKPMPDADRRTLIRRLYFDLTGLPPSPQDVDEFLTDDSGDALERLVDRLLESKQFGVHWGRHWLDVARYADSNGGDFNATFHNAWKYRDYVVNSFNQDKPFDQFVREQIAGDLLSSDRDEDRTERIIATGFLMIGAKMLSERDKLKLTMDVVDEQVNTVGQAFMGLTLGCARCHDHKFDPIPTRDYYALAGIFCSTRTLQGESQQYVSTWPRRSLPAKAEHVAAVQAYEASQEKLQAEIQRAKQLTDRLTKQLKNMRGGQSWPVGDDVDAKGGNGPLAARLASELLAAEKALKEHETQLKELKENAPQPLPKAIAVDEADKIGDSRVCIRGEHENLGPLVPRGVLQVVATSQLPTFPSEQSGRLELANWLAGKDHPLTARVFVNRIWHHLFGRGIVASVDNFGQLGERPTHPELLDCLAADFMNGGWSVKRAIRRIVLSRVYRMSSRHDERSWAADPDNRLLWRANRRRIIAESIRDSMLAISGQLDLSPAGSPVEGLGVLVTQNNSEQKDFQPKESLHRSLYLPMIRAEIHGVLSAFDFADPDLVTGRRAVTNVPAQALLLLNSPFVIEQAEKTAERIRELTDPFDDPPMLITRTYELVLSRQPTEMEFARAEAFLETAKRHDSKMSPLAQLIHTMFASTEFRMLN